MKAADHPLHRGHPVYPHLQKGFAIERRNKGCCSGITFIIVRRWYHHLGASIGLGYVPCAEPGEKAASMLESRYEIEVAGTNVAAIASLQPLYDPKSERVKA